MKRFLIAAGLAAFCASAIAATAPSTVTWSRPVTYTDGSALPVSSISGYKIGCNFTPTGGTASACTLSANTVAGSAQSFTATLTYPSSGGQACFTVMATAGGVDSAASAPACQTLSALAPSPPTNVTVTVTLTLNISSATPITVVASVPSITTKP